MRTLLYDSCGREFRYSLPMASFSFGLVLLFSSGIVLDPDYYTIWFVNTGIEIKWNITQLTHPILTKLRPMPMHCLRWTTPVIIIDSTNSKPVTKQSFQAGLKDDDGSPSSKSYIYEASPTHTRWTTTHRTLMNCNYSYIKSYKNYRVTSTRTSYA